MKVKKLAASTLAVATGVLGLNLVTANPAAAATGRWRPYGDVSPIAATSDKAIWVCGITWPVTADHTVLAQVCAIRAKPQPPYDASDSVQAAVIVRNNRSGIYGAAVATDLSVFRTGEFIDRWFCPSSGVAPGTWSVCYGTTIPNSINDKVVARGGVNGVDLPRSAQV